MVDAFVGTFSQAINAALSTAKMEADAFRTALLTEAMASQDLVLAIQSSPESVLQALTSATQLGLLVGRQHGQAYLIPRKQGGKPSVTLQLGFRGLLQCVMRHKEFRQAYAECVYADEIGQFFWDRIGKPVHPWRPGVDRSDEKLVAAYAWVEDSRGVVHAIVLEREQLLARRDRSDAFRAFVSGKVSSNPWHTDFAAMCRKTAIRALLTRGTVPVEHRLTAALWREQDEDDVERVRDAEVSVVGTQPVAAPGVGVAGLAEAATAADTEDEQPEQDEAAAKVEQERAAKRDALVLAMRGAGMSAWAQMQPWLIAELDGRQISGLRDVGDAEMDLLLAVLREAPEAEIEALRAKIPTTPNTPA